MKVLLLSTHVNIGGIGIYTLNLARHLKKKGVDVTVCSGGGNLEPEFRSENIPHFFLDIKTKSEFGLKVWKAVNPFSKFVKESGFDVIHAQTRVAQVLARLSQRSTLVPFVSTSHGFYRHWRLGRKIFPCWGDAVIAISKKVEEHLLKDFKLPPERVFQIYNGIEVDRFVRGSGRKNGEVARRIGLKEGVLTVGNVGRYSSVKGQKYLLSAFDAVVRSGYDLQLLFIGDDGGEKKSLETYVKESDLSGRVFFQDTRKTALEEYVSLMDIFCLPSLLEGLGLSLMEAMAAGCACVASDVGGIPELVEHGSDGILVPPADAGALAAALKKLADDPVLRRGLGDKARKKAVSDFSIDKTVDSVIKVYREVTGKG